MEFPDPGAAHGCKMPVIPVFYIMQPDDAIPVFQRTVKKVICGMDTLEKDRVVIF
jgi:hypothetical protein